MKVHPCVQGSREWLRLRMGRPTASQFHRIITAKKGQASTQQEGYMCELLAELMIGRPIEAPMTGWMERGKNLEAEAASFYSFQKDVELETVGFVTNEEGTAGCSPDRLIEGGEGLLEIKIPKAENHVLYLLYGKVNDDYRVQLQGQLFITGRKWADIISYHSEMPPAIVRVERDEAFLKLLDAELSGFTARLAEKRDDLERRGMLYKPQADPPEFLSEQDAEIILASIRQRETNGQHAIQ